jgi:putative flippase GtrA
MSTLRMLVDGLLEKGHHGSAPTGMRQKINRLDKRYHVIRLAKFAVASGTGFLLAEGILTLGVLLLYGKFSVSAPGDAYSSPAFLSLDVGALGIGVALSFFLNERFTLRAHVQQHKNSGLSSLPVRLLKFEGVNAMGNATIVAVQFVLLLTLSITPLIGNVVGAIVSYPITYFVSLHFVWKPVPRGSKGKGLTHRQGRPPKKVGPPSRPVTAMAFVASLYVIGRVLRRRKRHLAE